MSVLATLEAVRHRLEGNPFDTVPALVDAMTGRSAQPSKTVGLEDSADVSVALRRTTYARVQGLDVPVHWAGTEGKEFKRVYPSLTYDIIGSNPRFDSGYVYQSPSYHGDRYRIDTHQTETVYDGGEELGDYARAAKVRDVEQPFDVLVELRAYSLNPVLMHMLEVHVLTRVFLPRHFLRVPQQDGTYRSWDVLYQDAKDLDQRAAVRSGAPGVEREYGKSWTWKVEGYFDNTEQARLVGLVRERRLVMSKTDV